MLDGSQSIFIHWTLLCCLYPFRWQSPRKVL